MPNSSDEPLALSFVAAVLAEAPLTVRERVDRFAEFTELLNLLLRTDRVTWRGQYYAAADARSLPGCVQRPRLPFAVAANGRRAIGTAARFGGGWVTTGVRAGGLDAWWQSAADGAGRMDEELAAAGRAPGEMRRYLSLDASGTFAL